MTCELRPTVPSDLNELAQTMRKLDQAEVWASSRQTPNEALAVSYRDSSHCFTVRADASIVAIFGVIPDSLLSKRALVWMLTSEAIDGVKIGFLRRSKSVIAEILDRYSTLYNFVDSRHEPCLRWLRWCGARVNDAAPFGEDDKPFHYFELGEA